MTSVLPLLCYSPPKEGRKSRQGLASKHHIFLISKKDPNVTSVPMNKDIRGKMSLCPKLCYRITLGRTDFFRPINTSHAIYFMHFKHLPFLHVLISLAWKLSPCLEPSKTFSESVRIQELNLQQSQPIPFSVSSKRFWMLILLILLLHLQLGVSWL